jgi:hypothetical protein
MFIKTRGKTDSMKKEGSTDDKQVYFSEANIRVENAKKKVRI